jgi:hypothetical protein
MEGKFLIAVAGYLFEQHAAKDAFGRQAFTSDVTGWIHHQILFY